MYFKYLLPLLALTCMCSLLGCGTDNSDTYVRHGKKDTTSTVHKKYKYAVYIENSGSLNGYLNVAGDSSFKSNVYALITSLSTAPEKEALSLYDINTRTIPAAINADAAMVSDYLRHLDATTFKKRSEASGGNQAQSDLGAVFKTVLDSTDAHEVSILISDGIFSPGKKGEAIDYLSQQKNSITLFLNEQRKKQSFATLVLQFYSGFNGRYYYQDNSSRDGKFKDRPYYIICFGDEEALRLIQDRVTTQAAFAGFRNFLFLTDTRSYEVSPAIRSFTQYYNYDHSRPLVVTDIRKGGRDHKFRIKFNVDFSKLPVSETYLQEPGNYVLNPGYEIESVNACQQPGYTHEILLVAVAPKTAALNISLKKQLPGWIAAGNLDTDQKLPADSLSGKTFGIRYLLEGIYDAYAVAQRSSGYCSISISVKE